MTKKEAIAKARSAETRDTTYCDNLDMWYQRLNKLSVIELKTARIARALEYLGVEDGEAYTYAYDCIGIPFRAAVYGYRVKK